jgi:hypothetical protein
MGEGGGRRGNVLGDDPKGEQLKRLVVTDVGEAGESFVEPWWHGVLVSRFHGRRPGWRVDQHLPNLASFPLQNTTPEETNSQ